MEDIKILVVDDEQRMRKLVRDFLVKKGFQVLEASNGEEAIDVFFSEKNIELVILDVMMPKMDGWAVCREIRQYSQVPIVMLTAKSGIYIQAVFSEGACGKSRGNFKTYGSSDRGYFGDWRHNA